MMIITELINITSIFPESRRTEMYLSAPLLHTSPTYRQGGAFAVAEKFIIVKPNNSCADLGFEPMSSCSAIPLATNRPMRQVY